MSSFFTENGPCEVFETGLDEYETIARQWGWDGASNMIFIDQPNHVGFSYDIPTDGTYHMDNSVIEQPPSSDGSLLLKNGTFSSLNAENTASTSESAALNVWHVLQAFFAVFPKYEICSQNVHIFSEGYGGRFAPIVADTLLSQNENREHGTVDPNTSFEIVVRSVGIVNGAIDSLLEKPIIPRFANFNSYGLQGLSAEQIESLSTQNKNECEPLLEKCVRAAQANDPLGEGIRPGVNQICHDATVACQGITKNAISMSGRNKDDIAAKETNPFPPKYYQEYLNQAHVQRAIGSPVNFTQLSKVVERNFAMTGDASRGGVISKIASLIRKGVRVGLMYGDRDFAYNWLVGQEVAHRIAEAVAFDFGHGFWSAGFAPISVNKDYHGGDVKQYGPFSFSRIFQAGHAVAAYQPETAFQVFSRIIHGKSVDKGEDVDISKYNTAGSVYSTHKDTLPSPPVPMCFIRDMENTCPDDHDFLDQGVIINGIWYPSPVDWPLYTRKFMSNLKSTVSGDRLKKKLEQDGGKSVKGGILNGKGGVLKGKGTTAKGGARVGVKGSGRTTGHDSEGGASAKGQATHDSQVEYRPRTGHDEVNQVRWNVEPIHE